MFKIDRHEKIMQLLMENGSLLVSEACDVLNCSDQTIRRDLQELEEQGKLKRIHGGAYIPEDAEKGVPVQLREKLIVKEKLYMAQLAASSFISIDDVVMLDSSTTCNTLARQILSSGMKVSLITNSLATVSEFNESTASAGLICLGGRYRKRSGSFEGSETLKSISSYVADKAFISCNAISMEHGMLDNYESQKDIRRAMLENAREKYLLVDHTKFDDQASYIIGAFTELNGIITDCEPDEKWKSFFRDLGVTVIWQ